MKKQSEEYREFPSAFLKKWLQAGRVGLQEGKNGQKGPLNPAFCRKNGKKTCIFRGCVVYSYCSMIT